ncbi:XdhC family protein [Nocardia macrotermitis]|uniref:Putative xanthine dehydrogenase subunit A n=1 Tax=Nocardia macrotermitis TaxID=2585198 RepID=A0A7K0D6S5_9NOCA|nr:XdhC/CoxI family protein [Nocardia macrotermitis]MQY21456.1 putative xanthine dehydrogenase subunit A [Nocardia macrotermitis]
MRELWVELREWHALRMTYALATIVEVTGSAPRSPGASMAVAANGTVIGSISGGCVEGAVYDLCLEVLGSGIPARETFGYNDSDAFTVGLTCGGDLQVFVHRVTPGQYPAIESALSTTTPAALIRDLRTGEIGVVGPPDAPGTPFEHAVAEHAAAMLDSALTGIRHIGCDGAQHTVFIESLTTPPRLIICGATDFSAALCRAGRGLGYRVTLCDARPVFTTRGRFPDADEVVVDWPHRYLARTDTDTRTAVCVLSHDPKFDIPALRLALRLPVEYVGAMGSRRTDAERRSRLRAAGLTESELSRLHSPIGLQLGGRTPDEVAIAIGAELVAVRHGGSTRPLSDTEQPIHTTPGPQPTPA